MGRSRNGGLGFGIGSSPQGSIQQGNLDAKINKLSLKSLSFKEYIMKNNIHPHSLPIKDKPNSKIEQRDDSGRVIRIRYYDENGNAYKDVDYTDHGRPDRHKVPHTHIIEIGNIIDRKKGVLPYANR